MKKLVVVLLLLVIGAAAACGGAASNGASSGGPARLSVAPRANGSTGAGGGQPSSTGGGSSTTNPSTSIDQVPVLQGPPVIRQAQLAITVDSGKFDEKLAAVRTLVEQQGGFIAGTDASASSQGADSSIRTGVINFMVPAGNFDTTIDQVAQVGKLQSEHITGTDVSAQYVDLKARLDNLQAQRQAMLALLAQAKSVSDIIQVQGQLGQITGQIEEIEGQIKYLDQNTSYSTITVTLTESGAPAQQAPSDTWGFATALSGAAHNFVTTIDYVITAIGAVGPLLVLVLIGYIVWRRRRAPVARHA